MTSEIRKQDDSSHWCKRFSAPFQKVDKGLTPDTFALEIPKKYKVCPDNRITKERLSSGTFFFGSIPVVSYR